MAANASKRVRTESARKRQGRENEESLQHQATTKKASAKARKDRRDEAKEDDLLVEREGESDEMCKLRAHNLQLASDNERMRAQLLHRNKEDHPKPRKTIPEPTKLSETEIEDIREYLELVGSEHDYEWFAYRSDARQLLTAGGLNWRKRWAKQELRRRSTIITAFENRRPKLKDFANQWGATYILRECHNNILNYRKKHAPPGDTDYSSENSATLPDTSLDNPEPSAVQVNKTQPVSDDDEETRVRKMAYRKAALVRSVERKAAKLKARAELEAAQARQSNLATNDGETEPEDLPEEVRRTIEREEVGVPSSSNVCLKPVPKQKRRRADEDNTPNKSTAGLPAKRRAVVHTKYGGKGVSGSRRASCTATQEPDEEELSVTSGQTSSGSDDD